MLVVNLETVRLWAPWAFSVFCSRIRISSRTCTHNKPSANLLNYLLHEYRTGSFLIYPALRIRIAKVGLEKTESATMVDQSYYKTLISRVNKQNVPRQNVPRHKVPRDKTSQGTKRPKGQNVPRDKTSQGDKWGHYLICVALYLINKIKIKEWPSLTSP